MRRFEQHFIRHIELWLSAAGVVLAFLIPTVLGPGIDFWKAVALTALFVGFLHGIVFWSVKRRQASVRAQTIDEVRDMLRGLAWKRLSGSEVSASPSEQQTFEEVHRLVDTLTEERLKRWNESEQRAGRVANLTV